MACGSGLEAVARRLNLALVSAERRGQFEEEMDINFALEVGQDRFRVCLMMHKDGIYRFSWQVYVMSFLMAFFLYEKGFREMDFNFSWGYMYGIFFAFVGALLVLLRATANADTRKRRIAVAVQWLAYLWHLVCGVYYFWGFLQGAMYY